MRNLVNPDDLVNWWLEKYHNTNLDKVLEDNPDWKVNPQEHTREFYNKYRITQEQYNEWEKWAKEYTKKVTKLSKKMVDRGWWAVFLNCAPNIITEEDGKTEEC